jgi:hypothetical protein
MRQMDVLSKAEPLVAWKGSQGNVEIRRCRDRVVYLCMAGIVDFSAGPLLKRGLEQAFVGCESIHLFAALGELVNYHSEVRLRGTQVLVAHRQRLGSIQVHATSKIVSMGVAVVNLAVGGIIHSHESALSFETALREALLR